jgi:hypothetical protein
MQQASSFDHRFHQGGQFLSPHADLVAEGRRLESICQDFGKRLNGWPCSLQYP